MSTFEVAEYGIYFRSVSQSLDMTAGAPAIGRAGVKVSTREFLFRALAFGKYRELRADLNADVRRALGVNVRVRASSGSGDVQMNLGAVAAQASVEGGSARYEIIARGNAGFVADVNAILPEIGSFNFETQEKLQRIVTNTLPESIAPSQPGGQDTHQPEFVQDETAIEEYPDVSRLIVFAMRNMADGRTFKDTYGLARQKFGDYVDPRPLEYVFQALGCDDLSASTPAPASNQAFQWIDQVDKSIAKLVTQRNQ